MMSSMLLLLIEPWAVVALALGIALRAYARHARALAFTSLDWVLVVLASVGIVGDVMWNIWVLRGAAPVP